VLKEAARDDKDERRKLYKGERQRVPKSIRRERIKNWYLEKHGRVFKDSSFDLAAEQKALTSIEHFRRYGDFERCAETVEELRDAASVWEHRDIYTGLEPGWDEQLDDWGNELLEGAEEESEEEESEEEGEDLAGNLHGTENGAPLRNDEFDAWGGLSDWEEEDQTW
jgi:Ran GTPase-activating protein (RanGAP) involved in mRNA processing and transport